MKIGLKLWSTNDYYIPLASELFKKRIFNYIELFIVPNSLSYIPLWLKLSIPINLHAPHSYYGLNFSKNESIENNSKLLIEVKKYHKALNSHYIVFHAGVDGNISESIAQINHFKINYPEVFNCALIENKPSVGLGDENCIGSSPEEIELIKDNTGMGFCFDIGHAICFAASLKLKINVVFKKFFDIHPQLYHVSDGDSNSETDEHLNLGKGNYDLKFISKCISDSSMISIETNKNSKDNLDDFEADVIYLRKLLNEQDKNR